MIPKELLAALRTIEIHTARLATEQLSGTYTSSFKGQGLAFREVRPYQPGDDVRTIDWNVSARMNETFVKVFVEEREMTVMLVVDLSASERFGTRRAAKVRVASEIAALLAFSAIRNNDRVGLIVATDKIERIVPPKKGEKHVMRVVREIMGFEPGREVGRRVYDEKGRMRLGAGTDLKAALQSLVRVSRRRSIAFVVSDFYDTGYERALALASAKHDVVPVVMTDPRDMTLADVGLATFEDLENGESVLVDTSDPTRPRVLREDDEKDRRRAAAGRLSSTRSRLRRNRDRRLLRAPVEGPLCEASQEDTAMTGGLWNTRKDREQLRNLGALIVLSFCSLVCRTASAECVETAPSGGARPQIVDSFPERGTSGYQATLHVVVSHGKGLERSFHAGSSCRARAIRPRLCRRRVLRSPIKTGERRRVFPASTPIPKPAANRPRSTCHSLRSPRSQGVTCSSCHLCPFRLHAPITTWSRCAPNPIPSWSKTPSRRHPMLSPSPILLRASSARSGWVSNGRWNGGPAGRWWVACWRGSFTAG